MIHSSGCLLFLFDKRMFDQRKMLRATLRKWYVGVVRIRYSYDQADEDGRNVEELD